jgi:hypothetical protein
MMPKSGMMKQEKDPEGVNDASQFELIQWAKLYVNVKDGEQGGAAEQQNGQTRARPLTAPPQAPQAPPAQQVQSPQALSRHHQDLLYVFDKYICKREEGHGVTLMLHDVPYRFQVDPDVMPMIEAVGNIDAVDYIYLPMAVDRPAAMQCRNKGYCFVHFSDPAAAQEFANEIHNYKVSDIHCIYDDGRTRPPGKGIFAAMAKFQGLSLNLNNLLDIHSTKWRPRNGIAYVRTDNGLAAVRLLALRNLAKQNAQVSSSCERANYAKRFIDASYDKGGR